MTVPQALLGQFSFRRRVEFVSAFTQRELKSRYKNAFFGFFWMVLNPVFQMVVIGVVLQVYLRVDIEAYFQYLFIGLLAWNFFSLSLTKTAAAFVHERALLQKANFPRESLIISIILSNFVHLLIGIVLVMPFIQVFQMHVLIFVGAVLWLFLLSVGLSLFFSSLNVRFRDVSFFVQALLPIWFYATPIIYSLNLVPESIRFLILLNPLTAIFQYLHFSLLGMEPHLTSFHLGLSLAVSIFIVFVGWLFFKKENKTFADWL